jgi:hypothetical protein
MCVYSVINYNQTLWLKKQKTKKKAWISAMIRVKNMQTNYVVKRETSYEFIVIIIVISYNTVCINQLSEITAFSHFT